VELGRDASAVERVEEETGVAGVYFFVELGGVDEAGGGVFGDVGDGGDGVVKGLWSVGAGEGLHAEGAGDGGIERGAGVAEDGEVGVSAEGVDGVVGEGAGVVGIAVGCGGGEVGGHVSAGGEAPYADGVGPKVPVGGVAADEADGAQAVEHGGGIEVARAETVLEDVGADVVLVEPASLRGTFFFHDEVVVASAGEDDDGDVRAGAGSGIGEELRDVGVVFADGSGSAGGPEGFDGSEADGWDGGCGWGLRDHRTDRSGEGEDKGGEAGEAAAGRAHQHAELFLGRKNTLAVGR